MSKEKPQELEIYGPKETVHNPVSKAIDTIYHSLKDFNLITNRGDTVTQEILNNKIAIADFFFATCQTICPAMSNQLKRVQDKYQDDHNVIILSHTVDPVHDTPEKLQQYAESYGAIPGKWYFLTGDKKHIYELARKSYFLAVSDGDGSNRDFIHSQQLVLIDSHKRIRGYYDGTNPEEVNQLIHDIRILETETQKEKKGS
ncbi:MAG: SCO family protein [Bacteroidia bacterium]|nr:SCO family protein [Bacteroidia bacterium]MCZ2276567.1 SCO family protein [Bacteroidia bacterium]